MLCSEDFVLTANTIKSAGGVLFSYPLLTIIKFDWLRSQSRPIPNSFFVSNFDRFIWLNLVCHMANYNIVV